MTAFHRSTEWAAFVRRVKPGIQADIDSGAAVCVDCGKQIMPWHKWHVGHRLSQHTHPQHRLSEWNVGPSHASCNQSAGAKLGNQLRAQRKKRSTDYIDWRKTA